MFYLFDQNNSGGNFHHDSSNGIGYRVIIEADSADQANEIAENIGIYFNGCYDDREAAAVIRELMAPATPEPASDLVERVMARIPDAYKEIKDQLSDAVVCYGEPTGCIREDGCEETCLMLATFRKGVEYAAITAMPDRAALVEEVETIRLSNSLLEQFRKSDLEEITTLRTQLAASQADVARLRELTEALSKADGLCTFNRGDHRTIEFAFDEHDDGHKAFELLSDALATIKDTQP